MSSSDPVRELGEAVLAVLRSLPGDGSPTPEWVALDAEAKRRGKSTRQFREWCRRHFVEIRQENHRDAWVRPADVDRAVAEMPVVALATRGDEIDQEVDKAWGGNSSQARVSPRRRARST